ncbi:hypothetical protein BJI67_02055 [Acidihalobacter aeolianus]|uniref:Uncharacterized protein n=1 Tax=Acidihalobacter aeolianus TaxID=2792603 RepID=A0A1D8K4Z5_9GAMM|nr:hypothetical protein [Acidihalobacter aeolianus]AOV16016.1 hypothetical protein BJI67_02055 [Acidihalobacter aeolianus]
MQTKILIASTLALMGLSAAGVALASNASENHHEQSPAAEAQMLHTAKVGLDQAGLLRRMQLRAC